MFGFVITQAEKSRFKESSANSLKLKKPVKGFLTEKQVTI